MSVAFHGVWPQHGLKKFDILSAKVAALLIYIYIYTLQIPRIQTTKPLLAMELSTDLLAICLKVAEALWAEIEGFGFWQQITVGG